MVLSEYAENLLKTNNFRLTGPRKEVISILVKSKKPLNPYKISELIEKRGVRVDVSTVYRILKVLLELNLVHFNDKSQGYLFCSHVHDEEDDKCHHHFICNSCGDVEEFCVDDKNFLQKLSQLLPQNKILSHSIELAGVCSNCN